MDKNLITLFNTIQTFVNSNNNDFLMKEFIRNTSQEESIIEIDRNKGIVVCQDGSKFLFSTSLKRNVSSFYSKIKIDIDSIFIEISLTSKTKNYIENTLDYIIDSQEDLLITFPVYNKLIENIKNYLNEKYNLNIVLNKEPDYTSSYFKVKSGYSEKVFTEMYTIAIDNDIINDEKVSEKNFIDALTATETTCTIEFKVKNVLTVNFLECIKPFFENYNGKTIGNSKRFKTNGGTILTQTNYNRFKKISFKKDQEIISGIQSEIRKLL
ncbi:hypothetical protein [Flaviramulus aquimarinus]